MADLSTIWRIFILRDELNNLYAYFSTTFLFTSSCNDKAPARCKRMFGSSRKLPNAGVRYFYTSKNARQ